MPFMECIEVWKSNCKCGELIMFPVRGQLKDNMFRCKCGTKYVIDTAGGHFHDITEDNVQLEQKAGS